MDDLINPAAWVDKCRAILLHKESNNIRIRARNWTKLVNEKTKDTHQRLGIASVVSIVANPALLPFSYVIEATALTKHLDFVHKWNGLKQRQMQHQPKTYLELETKAKNWLNGRRAPNYASTLFPDMIKCSEIFAHKISHLIFSLQTPIAKMLCKVLIFGYLATLCSARISMNDVSKKAYLICENSVKSGKSPVSQILQRYASDSVCAVGFPSSLRQASDFFDKKYMELIDDLLTILNRVRLEKNALVSLQFTPDNKFIVSANANHKNSNSNSSSSSSRSRTNNNITDDDNYNYNNFEPMYSPTPNTNSIHSLSCTHTSSSASFPSSTLSSASVSQFSMLNTAQLAHFMNEMVESQRRQQIEIQTLTNRVSLLENKMHQQLQSLPSLFISQEVKSENNQSNSNHNHSNNHYMAPPGIVISQPSYISGQTLFGNSNNNNNNAAFAIGSNVNPLFAQAHAHAQLYVHNQYLQCNGQQQAQARHRNNVSPPSAHLMANLMAGQPHISDTPAVVIPHLPPLQPRNAMMRTCALNKSNSSTFDTSALPMPSVFSPLTGNNNNNNNNNNIMAYISTDDVNASNAVMSVMDDNLPNTQLGTFQSNESDINMNSFFNNQSFTSSDDARISCFGNNLNNGDV